MPKRHSALSFVVPAASF